MIVRLTVGGNYSKIFTVSRVDLAQLPPIKEEIAACFIDSEMNYKYQLTKVERQAGDNPLMVLYDTIRNNIGAKTDQFAHENNLIPRSADLAVLDISEIGYRFYPDLRDFGREVVNSFRSEAFEMDKNHCKVLCWTNQRILFWNASIRKTLLNDLSQKNIPHEQMLHAQTIMPDELLMGYKGYTDGIENSGEYEVLQMQYSSRTVEYGKKLDRKEMEISGYRVALRDVDQGTILNTFIVDPEPDEERKFVTVFNDYLWAAKTMKAWPAYFAFKQEFLLMRDIKDTRNTLICGKDLDYAYAISVHKSQGSTFNRVFVDEGNINLNRNWVERNKLKYVAFSRPRYLATILTAGG